MRSHLTKCAVFICVVATLAGCGTSSRRDDSATSNTTTAGNQVATSMYGQRYCEVLLVTAADGTATADVYNTYPLNDCPAAQWDALDAKAIAATAGVTAAVLNGPRHWAMDSIDNAAGRVEMTRSSFGGIEMFRQANVVLGPLADAGKRYVAHAVDRSTTFTFDTGRTVHELIDADGRVWVMQAWSDQVDPTLSAADLTSLGSRLSLPTGWTYRSRVLAEPLKVVTTTQAAKVLQDDLSNSYSLETTN